MNRSEVARTHDGFGPDSSSFLAPIGSLIGNFPGEINQGTNYGRPGEALIATIPLSPEDGQRLVDELQKMRYNPPAYSALFRNCHDFADAVMALAAQLGLQF